MLPKTDQEDSSKIILTPPLPKTDQEDSSNKIILMLLKRMDQEECFYFSNMAAQYHSLNAGDWKSVETLERDLASTNDSIHIWCGNIGVLKKIGSTSAPLKCWKVIHIKKPFGCFF